MALQVWLPLNKDLRQQGLSNVTVTNNGATFDSAGKLGGCYYFNGSSTVVLPSYNTTRSIAFWLKAPKTNSTIAFVDYKSKLGFGFQSSGYIIPNCADSSLQMYAADNFIANTWNHIVLTRDDNLTDVLLYINGELQTNRISSTNYWTNTVDGCYLGGRSTGTYMTCYMNDFRVYDHCLSPMEVKELSKGLVLHYPLNRQGWGQENLLTETNFTAASIGSMSVSNAVNLGLWRIENSNVTLAMDGNYVKLHYEASTSRYGIHYEISLEPGTYTYSITAGGRLTCTFGLATSWPSTNLITANSAGRYSATFTVSETATYRMYIYTTSANPDIWFNWPKLEKGDKATPWCPNSSDTLATTLGLNGTTEYDCSGYCNNGIKNNSPTYFSDTAKYHVSTHLDGINQTIQLPNLTTLISDSIFTFNVWFKRLESEPGSKPWETILGGPSGFELESCSANNVHDAKIRAYSWGSGSFAFEFDKWNMLTMVSNGTNALFYLNGELKLTGTYKALVSGNYFLGSWRDTSTQNYRGYMSDARIYATALSANDVLSLYQNSAYIDSFGNVYGAVHLEV